MQSDERATSAFPLFTSSCSHEILVSARMGVGGKSRYQDGTTTLASHVGGGWKLSGMCAFDCPLLHLVHDKLQFKGIPLNPISKTFILNLKFSSSAQDDPARLGVPHILHDAVVPSLTNLSTIVGWRDSPGRWGISSASRYIWQGHHVHDQILCAPI